jgi:hypothetical protein
VAIEALTPASVRATVESLLTLRHLGICLVGCRRLRSGEQCPDGQVWLGRHAMIFGLWA